MYKNELRPSFYKCYNESNFSLPSLIFFSFHHYRSLLDLVFSFAKSLIAQCSIPLVVTSYYDISKKTNHLFIIYL